MLSQLLVREGRPAAWPQAHCLEISRSVMYPVFAFGDGVSLIPRLPLKSWRWWALACAGWSALSKNSHSPQCVIGSLPFLLRLAQTAEKRSAEGVESTLPVSNQEPASQIGTVRELVSRNFSRLQAEGILKIDGRSVTTCNLKALEAETQSAE